MAFKDEIVNAICESMPPDADIRVVSLTRGFDVSVSWKLNDDPERPNKMSKSISIHVSHEAAQDFASTSAHNQAVACRRVKYFLSQKLLAFDPRHDASKCESPPVERWVIESNLIIG